MQTIMVLSIRGIPVKGSRISGNSLIVSTTSPALSPQAATITMSTFALRLVICCNTVLPAPKGPGIQYVPPFATGNSVSIILILVISGSAGFSLSLYNVTGLRIGHSNIMLNGIGDPLLPLMSAICSLTLYSLGSAISTTSYLPDRWKGTIILCVKIPSLTVPTASAACSLSPGFTQGVKAHLVSSGRALICLPL